MTSDREAEQRRLHVGMGCDCLRCREVREAAEGTMTRDDWATEASRKLLCYYGIRVNDWPALVECVAGALRAERAQTAARCAEIADEAKRNADWDVGIRTACLIREQIRREFFAVAWVEDAQVEANQLRNRLRAIQAAAEPVRVRWELPETDDAQGCAAFWRDINALLNAIGKPEPVKAPGANDALPEALDGTPPPSVALEAPGLTGILSATHYQHYYSTYCIHSDHEHCRKTCKTCKSPCLCACHGKPAR